MSVKINFAVRAVAAAALSLIAAAAIGQSTAAADDPVPFTVDGWSCEWFAEDEKGYCDNESGESVSIVYRDAPTSRADQIDKAGGRIGTITMDVQLGSRPDQQTGKGAITAEGTVVGPKDGDGFLTVQGGGLGNNVEVAHLLQWR